MWFPYYFSLKKIIKNPKECKIIFSYVFLAHQKWNYPYIVIYVGINEGGLDNNVINEYSNIHNFVHHMLEEHTMKDSERKKKSTAFMSNVVIPFFEKETKKVSLLKRNMRLETVVGVCEHTLEFNEGGNYRSLLRDGFHELLESEVDSAHPYGPDDNGH